LLFIAVRAFPIKGKATAAVIVALMNEIWLTAALRF
jgi:uncharacterized protein YggU (UPF0235/DUF167 family)